MRLSRRGFLLGVTALAAVAPAFLARAGLINQSGPRRYSSSSSSSGGGGGGGWPSTADKYVSSTGSNAAAGTLGAPYQTITFALSQISAGQSVMVLSNLSENLNLSTISGGSVGSYKTVVSDAPTRTITGTVDGSGTGSKYLKFQGFHWMNGANETDCTGVQFVKFIYCGFQGGVAAAGNTAQHLGGSNQLYESCWWVTSGGRYASITFEQSNTLYRWCVIRTDTWGSPADDGNPNAAFQLYSSNNCARIQCVAVDCKPQRTNNEWLANFATTTNTGVSVGIMDQECFGIRGPDIGWQVEGANNCTYTGLGNVSVGNSWGFVENLHSGGGSITMTGGEYSKSTNSGVASFGSEGFSPTLINTVSNTGGNFNGVAGGAGCTTNALDMNGLVTNMVKRGLAGTMYNETGWNVQQAGEFMFPLPQEVDAKAKYVAYDTLASISPRGWTASGVALTPYLKSVT